MDTPPKQVNNDQALEDVHRDKQVTAANDALAREKTKRRSKPLLVFLLALLMAVLGGAATLAVYKAYFEKPSSSNTTTTPTVQNSTTTPKITANEALATVKTVFPGTSSDFDTPLYAIRVPGYAFNTDLRAKTDYVGLKGDVSADDNAVKMAEIGKALKAKAMTEELAETNSMTDYVATYKGSDAVCKVTSAGTADNIRADHAVTAVCANMSSFKEVAALQKPFYEAALTSGGFTIDTTAALYGRPVTKQSKTTGYTLASLMLGAANMGAGSREMLFYRKGNDVWHYVTSKNDVGPGPACSDFTTPEAKKAYVGETCYNGSAATTVTP